MIIKSAKNNMSKHVNDHNPGKNNPCVHNPSSRCQICLYELTRPCALCQVEFHSTEPVEKGVCGDKFHVHCLSSWLENNDTGPLCRQVWEPINNWDPTNHS